MKKFKKAIATCMALFLIGNTVFVPGVSMAEETVVVQAETGTSEDAAEEIVEAEPVAEEPETTSEESLLEEPGEALATDTEEVRVEVAENTEVTDDSETEAVSEENSEVISEEISEDISEEISEEVSETVTEAETEEESETSSEVTVVAGEEKYIEKVSGISTSGIDFSSKELLIGTTDASIFTKDTEVVSMYDGIYLTRYASAELTEAAYTYYYNKVDFVSANISFRVADTSDSDLSEINTGDDALANLNEMNPVRTPEKTIAVIDSGINAKDLVDAVSVIGDDVSDRNGHGTLMYGYIRDVYPAAKVLSIKAIDDKGNTKADALVAALKYAIESKVDVINLSLSAYSRADNAAVKTAIDEAIKNGITVVGAAGNNGYDAKYYIPGNIEEATIVGSCDAEGKKLESSNYGASVDYYVVAESTSEAAAKMSAYLAKGTDLTSVDTVFRKLITDEGEVPLEDDGEFFVTSVHPSTENGFTKPTSVQKTDYYDKLKSNIPLDDVWGKTYSHCVEYVVKNINAANLTAINGDVNISTKLSTVDELFYELAGPGTGKNASNAGVSKIFNSTKYSFDKVNSKNNISTTNYENFELVYSYTDLQGSTASAAANADTAARRLNNAIASGMVKAGDIVVSVYDLQNINGGGTHFKHAFIISDMLFGTEATIRGNAKAFVGGTASKPSLNPYRDCNASGYAATKYNSSYVGYPTTINYFNDSVEVGSALGAMFGAGEEKEGNGFFVFRMITTKKYNASIWKTGKDANGNDSHKSLEGIEYTLYDGSGYAIATFTMDEYGYAKSVTIQNNAWTAVERTFGGYTQYFATADLSEEPTDYYFLETKPNANFALNDKPVAAIINEGDVPTTAKGISDFTTGTVDYEVAPTEYYVAIRKLDQNDELMNGVYFDVSVNGKTYTQMMDTGWYSTVGEDGPNWYAHYKPDKANYESTINGIAVCYIGNSSTFDTVPEVRIRENWTKIDASVTRDKALDPSDYLERSPNTPAGQPLGYKVTVYTSRDTAIANATAPAHTWYNDKKTAFTLVKTTDNTGCDVSNNPNYSLAGAEYKFFKTREAANAALAVRNSGKTNYSSVAATLTTDVNGETDTVSAEKLMRKENGVPQATTLYAIETKAPEHFKISDEVYELTIGINNDEQNPAVLSVSDKPVDDPIYFHLTKQSSGGSINLPGAEVTIKYYAEDITKNYTFTDLQAFTPAETIVKTTDADGKLLIDKHFAMGYLTVEETKAPEGFMLDGGTATVNGVTTNPKMAFVLLSKPDPVTGNTGYIHDDAYLILADGSRSATGAGLSVEASNPVILSDQAIRGDLSVQKYYDKGEEPLEGVIFEITSKETGEKHRIVTDANGFASTQSAYQKHGENQGYYDDGKKYDKTKAGIWFSLDPENPDTVDESVGALPKGAYVITEISANGVQLEEPIEIVVGSRRVDNNGVITWEDLGENGNGIVYEIYDYFRGDGKTVINDMPMPRLGTLAVVSDPAELHIDPNTELQINAQILAQVSKVLPADKNQTVYDICTYSNLKCDTTYTLKGVLMQKKGGKLIPFATGETTFTTKKNYETSRYEACGTVVVQFTGLDLTDIEGTSFVVYERLYLEDTTLEQYPDSNNTVVKFPLIHEDADDAYQTVKTPIGPTTADNGYGKKAILRTSTITIRDRVDYQGLEVGKEYLLEGHLYRRPDDDPEDKVYSDAELADMMVKDEAGNPITAQKSFTPTNTNGTVYVTFTFDASLLRAEAESFVVFEDCYDKERKVKFFSHSDIHDEGQTVYSPRIGTTAESILGRQSVVETDEKFYDTVFYENLDPDTTYTIKGVAMDKKTGEPLLLNGHEVRAEMDFTTGNTVKKNGGVDGAVKVTFIITKDMQADLGGKHFVIFEYVYDKDGNLVADHTDLLDEDQELMVPVLGTDFTDVKTGTHAAYPEETMELIDRCHYEKLLPGKAYTLDGVLMNKKTGEPMLDKDGNKITGHTDFIASETGEGYVDVKFTFNASILYIQGTSIVAFEECKPQNDKIPVCVHMDINDRDQTVDIPRVGTIASTNVVNKTDTTATLKVTDQILLTNLNTAYSYTAKGWLVDRNGNKVVIDGKEIYAEKDFTMSSPNGSIEVEFPEFTIDRYSTVNYVVFEEVYVNVTKEDESIEQYLLGEHKDTNDDKQFVTYTDKITGDTTNLILLFSLLGLSLMGAGFVLWRKKKKQ